MIRRATTRDPMRSGGFSLLELLVVMAILALLTSIMLGSLAKVRSAGRAVVCMNNLKTVGQEFFLFADGGYRAYRVDNDPQSRHLFRLEDFQEKLYRIHEFWDSGSAAEVPLDSNKHMLVCPASEGARALVKRKDLPCSSLAIAPPEGVSVGFNMRLDQVATTFNGWSRLQRTRLSARVLDRAEVPLAFSVDGLAAAEKGVLPYYAAPPAGDTGLYGTGRFWFPSLRHDGKMNVVYVGGHVHRTADPGTAAQAHWKYQPPLQ